VLEGASRTFFTTADVKSFSPGHYVPSDAFFVEQFVGLVVGFAVLEGVAQLVFMSRDNDAQTETPDHPGEVKRPDVGEQHIYRAVLSGLVDPREVLFGKLVACVDHAQTVGGDCEDVVF